MEESDGSRHCVSPEPDARPIVTVSFLQSLCFWGSFLYGAEAYNKRKGPRLSRAQLTLLYFLPSHIDREICYEQEFFQSPECELAVAGLAEMSPRRRRRGNMLHLQLLL